MTFPRHGGLIALALLFLVPLAFLFAPTVPDSDCLRTLHIGQYAKVTHNCDTPSMIASTIDLGRFFSEGGPDGGPWRTRPVYILLSAAASFVFEPVAVLVRPLFVRWVTGTYSIDNISRRLPLYLGLLALNALVLIVTVRLGAGLLGGMNTPLAFALGGAIVTTDIVHGWFWVLHFAFMNLLMPMGCIFFFVQGCRFRLLSFCEIMVLGLLVAASILSYGFAITWIPAAMLGWLFMAWRNGRLLPPLLEFTHAATFAVAACLPVVLWVAFIHFYMQHSVAYETGLTHQFVWIKEGVAAGQPLLTVLGDKMALFKDSLGQHLLPLALYPLAAAGVLLLIGGLVGGRDLSASRFARDPVLAGVVTCLLCMLIFNFFQGYFQARLQQPLIVALFVAVARLAWLLRLELIGTALLLGVAAEQFWLAFQAPPVTMS